MHALEHAITVIKVGSEQLSFISVSVFIRYMHVSCYNTKHRPLQIVSKLRVAAIQVNRIAPRLLLHGNKLLRPEAGLDSVAEDAELHVLLCKETQQVAVLLLQSR